MTYTATAMRPVTGRLRLAPPLRMTVCCAGSVPSMAIMKRHSPRGASAGGSTWKRNERLLRAGTERLRRSSTTHGLQLPGSSSSW
ncbi:hypothetical protein [Variovorax sp. UC74_104]|uniref:hypothetical protein n=1 Tax=Variovorax sp. UC74_104 TaxID=3374555 RepID=UPI00375645D7